mmetsp:Transcript_103821/g.332723  ORF Transcript_103821/g.332723 Transcript_103821/m.332723 type:complete len:328 (+) Transcript_103821:461-1444(+)
MAATSGAATRSAEFSSPPSCQPDTASSFSPASMKASCGTQRMSWWTRVPVPGSPRKTFESSSVQSSGRQCDDCQAGDVRRACHSSGDSAAAPPRSQPEDLRGDSVKYVRSSARLPPSSRTRASAPLKSRQRPASTRGRKSSLADWPEATSSTEPPLRSLACAAANSRPRAGERRRMAPKGSTTGSRMAVLRRRARNSDASKQTTPSPCSIGADLAVPSRDDSSRPAQKGSEASSAGPGMWFTAQLTRPSTAPGSSGATPASAAPAELSSRSTQLESPPERCPMLPRRPDDCSATVKLHRSPWRSHDKMLSRRGSSASAPGAERVTSH